MHGNRSEPRNSGGRGQRWRGLQVCQSRSLRWASVRLFTQGNDRFPVPSIALLEAHPPLSRAGREAASRARAFPSLSPFRALIVSKTSAFLFHNLFKGCSGLFIVPFPTIVR